MESGRSTTVRSLGNCILDHDILLTESTNIQYGMKQSGPLYRLDIDPRTHIPRFQNTASQFLDLRIDRTPQLDKTTAQLRSNPDFSKPLKSGWPGTHFGSDRLRYRWGDGQLWIRLSIKVEVIDGAAAIVVHLDCEPQIANRDFQSSQCKKEESKWNFILVHSCCNTITTESSQVVFF